MTRMSSPVVLVCLGGLICACASRTTPAKPGPSPGALPVEETTAEAPPAPASIPAAPQPVPTPSGDSQNCQLSREPGDPVRLVGLTEPVDPSHAPHPSNESERLVFRQLYETLVRVDCEGRLRQGLAESWLLGADGRTWVVTLRGGASFSDTTPVTSASVVASWSVEPGGGDLRPQAHRLVESVAALDDRRLAIVLRNPAVGGPVALAHTDLAIAQADVDSPWPAGTRLTRASTDDARGPLKGASTIRLTHVQRGTSAADSSDAAPFLTFIVAPGRDGRDLIDAGVDLMVTRAPGTLDYVATLPDYGRYALPWRHTRVFLARGQPSVSLTPVQRQTLAVDAVRGESRGAEEPFWWQALSSCDLTPPRQPSPLLRSTRRIVYDADDDAARDVAERLVGLAGAPRSDSTSILSALLPDRARGVAQRAIGLTGEALAIAQHRGNDAGYVMTLERSPLDPCAELQRVIEHLEWLTPDAVVPMVDTRASAILRMVRSHVRVEGDGGMLLDAGRGEMGR